MSDLLELSKKLTDVAREAFCFLDEKDIIRDEHGNLIGNLDELGNAIHDMMQYLQGAGKIKVIDKRHQNALHAVVANSYEMERENFHEWLAEQIEGRNGMCTPTELDKIMQSHIFNDLRRLNRDIVQDDSLLGIDWYANDVLLKYARKNGIVEKRK